MMSLCRIHCHLNLPFASDAASIPSTFHSPNSSPILSTSIFTTKKVTFSSIPRRTCGVVRSQLTMEGKPLSQNNRMLSGIGWNGTIFHCSGNLKLDGAERNGVVYVPAHPLIKHWVSVLRNEQTPCPIFRNAMAELGRLLMYEASRDWLPTVSGEIQSPLGVASVEFIDPREPIAVIPILRAGLALAEHASSILPAIKTYHLGISRNEETLQPTIYLNKLPENFAEGSKVFLVDPMLATGGTIVAALNLLKDRGVSNKQIKVISACSSPPALEKLSNQFPGLEVYTGIIDPVLNDKGFIIPGLGDAGDRSYGT